MKKTEKLIFILCFLILNRQLFCKEITKQEIKEINSVLSLASYDNSTYIGMSPRMSFREKELEYAEKHIANQIKMNEKCTVDFGYASIKINERIMRSYNPSIDWDDDNVLEIIKKLEIVKTFFFDHLTVVIAKYITSDSVRYVFPLRNTGRPDWIQKTPEIDGYFVAVGCSLSYKKYDPKTNLYKALISSDIDASQQISQTKNLLVVSEDYRKHHSIISDDEYVEKRTIVSTGIHLSHADLYGFYVIDRWIDYDGSCYSLAIAEKR